MIEMSPALDKIAPALHAAQGLMTGVVKDAKNPHFKNNYATLEAVVEAARPGLQANGLSVTQAPAGIVDGSLAITTMLLHTSGQWLRSTLHVPLGQKRDAQAVGSAISYGRRYALMAVLGLPSVDDDGQSASAPAPASASSQRATRSQRPTPQSEQTSSQRMAVELMAALSERAGSRVDRLWDNPEFQADIRMLDDEDLQRVKDFADERRAVKPDVRAA